MEEFKLIKGDSEYKIVLHETKELTAYELRRLYLRAETELNWANYYLSKGKEYNGEGD